MKHPLEKFPTQQNDYMDVTPDSYRETAKTKI